MRPADSGKPSDQIPHASTASTRLCIVAPEFIGPFPNGGVGTACYWEAVTLGQAGFDVTVLYTGSTERESPEYWEAHFGATAPFRYVDLSRWAATTPLARTIESFEQPCPEARTAEQVLAFLEAYSFDLVLFQEFLAHGARALQARASGAALLGVRAATTMHSCRQWIFEGMHRLPSSPADVAVNFLERESARLADSVIAPSRHMADWGARHWKLTRETAVIPYCYDAALARERTVIEHAGPFRHLVFFGRLETRKGLHLFCRALAMDPAIRETVERVTFLGKQSSVEGVPSREFIAAAMAKVPTIAWELKSDLGSFEALSWLSSQEQVLVVAPSVVDNLPYALIELYCRRIPFVSTEIGGIPEIVGGANRHALAAATDAHLAALLGRVCRDGRLTIDYRSGYDVASANATHVDFVRRLIAAPPPAARAEIDERFTVVAIDARDDDELARVRARFTAADGSAAAARWMRFDEWRSRDASEPALFVDGRVTPEDGMTKRLLRALQEPGVDAVTSYYRRGTAGDACVIAPLGASVESGWAQNTFGGPCLAARPSTFGVLRDTAVLDSFRFWPAYAGLACANLHLTLVPEPLYSAPPDAVDTHDHLELEAVIRQYHTRAPANLDFGWLLKSARGLAGGHPAHASRGDAAAIGRSIYERMVLAPDDETSAYARLTETDDPFALEFGRLRARLSSLASRWSKEQPRVFIYGAGQHAKLVLWLCPEVGQFVAGFIDRRPLKSFLGKPCIRPEEFRSELADAILYSSREFESDMYARMKGARVEHVLLYRDSPAADGAMTSSRRLENRFGHTAPDSAALYAMYQPPRWASGYISHDDADFLAGMVAALQPRTIVELGVASGASSAVLLQALDRLPESTEGRLLLSCDVNERCYFDEQYATGQGCREMYPNPRAIWRTEFTMDARRLSRALPPSSVDLAFIDANHLHPWPLLDLLHLTAVAKPASWIVLHDIELPVQHPKYQIYGPRWLFEAWPFNKIKGLGEWASIGAIQLPADQAQLVPFALRLLDRPWESSPRQTHVDLPETLAEIQTALEQRLAPVPTPVEVR